MAQEQNLQQKEIVEPEDPEYELEEHILTKRREQILRKNFQQLLAQNVSQLSRTFDGSSYAFTKLSLINKGVSVISESISKYPHLRKLELNHNLLRSKLPLLKLKYVVSINLTRNLIEDFNCLANQEVFPHLEYLNLSHNKINRMSPVSIRKIRHLVLSHNLIDDVTDFEGSHSLEILELRSNKIKRLKGLGRAPKLKQLYLADNLIEGIEDLKELKSLERLHVRKNKISKLEKFPQLQTLQYLNLRENLISKLEHLKVIPGHVKILNILANPISEELADNTKKEVWMVYRQFDKINKAEVTADEKQDFDKEYKDRLAEKELEKEAADRQAQLQQKEAE